MKKIYPTEQKQEIIILLSFPPKYAEVSASPAEGGKKKSTFLYFSDEQKIFFPHVHGDSSL